MITVPAAPEPPPPPEKAIDAVVYPDPAAVIETPPTEPLESTACSCADVSEPPPEKANCTTSPGR